MCRPSLFFFLNVGKYWKVSVKTPPTSEFVPNKKSCKCSLYFYSGSITEIILAVMGFAFLQKAAASAPVRARRPEIALFFSQADPKELIRLVTQHVAAHSGWPEELQALINQLHVYNERLTDFTQAQVLQGLGRGVDVHRFSSDPDYKKETILGLTE